MTTENLPDARLAGGAGKRRRFPWKRFWLASGAAALVLAAVFGRNDVRRRFAPDYVVKTGGEALYRSTSVGPRLDVFVQCNRRRLIVDSVMVVESLADDRGKDLMRGPLDALRDPAKIWPDGMFQVCAVWKPEKKRKANSWRGEIWGKPVRAKKFAWKIRCPRRPAQDAKSVRLKGRIELLEGGRVEKCTVDDVELRMGVKFRVAGHLVEVAEFYPGGKEGEPGWGVLRVLESGIFIESILAAAPDGKSERRAARGNLVWWKGAYRCDSRNRFRFGAPPGARRVALTMKVRTDMTERTLPVDLEFPIRETDDPDPRNPFGPCQWSFRAPEESDWGKPSTGNHAVGVPKVGNAWSTGDRIGSYTAISFALRFGGDETPGSVHFRLDALKDGLGRDLLNPKELRSDQVLSLCVESEPRSVEADSRLLWMVSTEPLVPGPYEGAGVCRFAFGEGGTETVVVPGRVHPIGNPLGIPPPNHDWGTAVEAGPVTMAPCSVTEHRVCFKVTGNLGMVGEVAALDEKERVLASRKPGIHFFDCRECKFWIGGENLDAAQIRSWRITYWRKCRWSEQNFEFYAPSVLVMWNR